MPYADIEKRRQRARERDTMKRAGEWTPQPNVKKADDIQCSSCGETFYRSPANRLRNGQGQYCSRKCMADAYIGRNTGDKSPRWKGRIDKMCNNCGAVISRPQWHINQADMAFCDHTCFGQWKSKNWTGEDNPCWRGGHAPYYGANWKRQQSEARRRDKHVCQLCGIAEKACRRALNVHHIVPFRFFGVDRYKEANTLRNLISLCDSCHKIAERPSQSGVITDWTILRSLALLDLAQTDQEDQKV